MDLYRHARRHLRGLARSRIAAHTRDGQDGGRLHLALHGYLPAPDQDDHRAVGVLDPRRRGCAYGRYGGDPSYPSEDHGLVHHRVVPLAAAEIVTRQPSPAW